MNNAKRRDITVEIIKDDIKTMYIKQGKRCALTGYPLTFGRRERTENDTEHNYNKNNISVDRKDPKQPYTKDNCHLVTAMVNRTKYEHTIDSYKKMCNDIINYQKLSNKQKEIKYELNKNNNTEEDVRKFIKLRYGETLSNAKRRNIEVEVTENDIFEMYQKSKGHCYLSGEVLACERNNKNSLSIDRIDSSKNYTKDNIQIVTGMINACKNDYSNNDFINICRAVVAFKGLPENNMEDQKMDDIDAEIEKDINEYMERYHKTINRMATTNPKNA